MTVIFEGVEGLKSHIGQHVGYGKYVEITQERINLFADATGDHQWIHVDEEKAKSGPYGKTIAHGLLVLSMIGDLAEGIFQFNGFKMGLNYGYDRIRFPSTTPVGSEVRLGVKVLSVEDVPKGVQTTLELTIEAKGAEKPSCIAHMIFRHFV